jgi:hypothetical protein
MFFKKYKKKITEQSEIIEKLNTRLSEDGINQLAQAKKQLLVENSNLESELFSIKSSLQSEQEQVKKLTSDNESLKERLASTADELQDLKKEFRLVSEKLENETVKIKPTAVAFNEVEAKQVLFKFFSINGYDSTKTQDILTHRDHLNHPVLIEAISYLYQKDISIESIATICNQTVNQVRGKVVRLGIYKKTPTRMYQAKAALKNKDECVHEISSLLNINYLSSFIKIEKGVLRLFCEKLNESPKNSNKLSKDDIKSFEQLFSAPVTRKQKICEQVIKVFGMEDFGNIYTIERVDKSELIIFCRAIINLYKN